MGAAYSSLFTGRMSSDYGGYRYTNRFDAKDAVEAARLIVEAVHDAYPDDFQFPDDFAFPDDMPETNGD